MAEDKKRGRFKFGFIPLGGFHVESEKERSDLVSVILFTAGAETLAVDVNYTEGVVDCPAISPLPRPPETVVGVTSVRGKITVVVDLGRDERTHEEGDRRRLILLRGDAQLGLLADRVESVLSLEPEKIKRLPKRKTVVAALASTCFKHNGRQVPIVEIERLTEM